MGARMTKLPQKDASKITNGIFAPWAFYRKDFQEIGGHDIIFAPQSKEDSDISETILSLLQSFSISKYFSSQLTLSSSHDPEEPPAQIEQSFDAPFT